MHQASHPSDHFVRRLSAATLAVAIALATAACRKEETRTASSEAPTPIRVGVFDVVERPIHPGMSFVGRVQAVNTVDITARVEGFVVQRTFTEGQAVKAGDLLFVLEKAPLEAALQASQANLAKVEADANNAKVQADRARLLYSQNTISQSTLDDRVATELQAKAAVQQAQASLKQAEINLGYTDIRAPFDGRVGVSNFSIGALVGPSSGALTSVISQDPIYAAFPVSDATILTYTQGNRADLSTNEITVQLVTSDNKTYPHPGKIDFTGVKVDENTDTVLIRAVFPNPDNRLLDGQFARVSAEIKSPVQALVIPQKAVLTNQSGNYVFVVGEDNKAAQRQVTQGETVGTDVVIRSGLQKGDRVIVDGLQRVRPGQPIDPQPIDPQPAATSPVTPPETPPAAGN
ncbi:efflux RND transporter periplasmic adaptor subunit [Pseudorhizobium sp. NPDC055634]